MAIIHKGTSPATLAANRTNSRKSTGPVTERGQMVSRRNALKHWGRAETIRPLLAALEEEPEEFDEVREALYRALAPRDEFEALLVDDMADVHWRLRERKTLEEERDARYDSGKFHDLNLLCCV